MKKISLELLLRESGSETYKEQYQYVCKLIEKKYILPVKSSPLNGKKPALHQNYWLVEETLDYKDLIEELKFHILPMIKTDYYLNHLDVYQEERNWVRLLNNYFSRQSMRETLASVNARDFAEAAGAGDISGLADTGYVSLNERSFQIWGREKFLQKEQGRKILAHCGIELEQLHVYNTSEPLACYSATRKIPQNVLILENKDTFYSMRRYLMKVYAQDKGAESCNTERDICDNKNNVSQGQIFGVETGTLVYGAGKGILRSYEDFRFCVEPHINHPQNQMLYFGDLDYEGIGIYERLAVLFDNKDEIHKVKPFIQAYEKLVEKAEACGIDFLPETSEKQNRNLSGVFFSYFSEQMKDKILHILEAGKYIPQEIINIMDF